jgi:phosphate-selective porin
MSTITAELPDSVLNSMKHLAKVEGMPVERLAALAIAQAVGAWSIQQEDFAERATRGNRSRFEAAMNKVPTAPPLPGDE